MALTEHYFTKFEQGNFYHIYNRSVDKKPMFKNDRNYEFFLNRYNKYLSTTIDTYAYCLLGNHFHLLVGIPVFDTTTFDLTTFQKLSNQPVITTHKTTHDIVSHQFRKFFQSYAMAFNKEHSRIGTLFQTPFKRALVDSDDYFRKLVYYIHANPQTHGLVDDFRDWEWSSFNKILTDQPCKLKKKELMDKFGDLESFKLFHSKNKKNIYDHKMFLED